MKRTRQQPATAPAPSTPSLRGLPTPAELSRELAAAPRTLLHRLRIGSRLEDLAPTLDSARVFGRIPNGRTAILSRGPGLKGYLAKHRIPAPYCTLMRYKHLVSRLRALLALDPRIPLEWILPGAKPTKPFPPSLRPGADEAARKLARILAKHDSVHSLSLHLDKRLGN